MDHSFFWVVLTVFIALIFDLVNGFHDAANSIATVVSTRVLKPKTAVLWAAFFNFVAMFIFAPRVAETISQIVKIDPDDMNYIYVILNGVVSAILWNLLTWWLKLPTSSSHALIGGYVGAGVAYAGWNVIYWNKLWEIILFIVLAPILGFILGFVFLLALYWLFRRSKPQPVNQFFRHGQLFSAALYSIGHGANDAQKTMGIIMALLLAAGYISSDTTLSLLNPQTAWIIIACQAAMALGTAFGGWRIVKTMGMRITKLKPIAGFCAETGGALTLFLVSYMGIPVSTTHTITGSIMGAGTVANRLSGVRWGVAARIIWAWVLTLPLTAGLSAFFWFVWSLISNRG
jgi:inorganic phosphate transporter, PiT family